MVDFSSCDMLTAKEIIYSMHVVPNIAHNAKGHF